MNDEPIEILDTPEAQPLTYTQETAQTQIDRVMADPKHPYFDASNPKHRDAVADMTRLHQQRHPEEQTRPRFGEEPDIHALRRQVGAAPPPEVTKHLDWDDVAESEIHDWALREQLPATTVQALFDFYLDRVALPGTPLDTQLIDEFRKAVSMTGLNAKQQDQLIRWYTAFAAGVQ